MALENHGHLEDSAFAYRLHRRRGAALVLLGFAIRLLFLPIALNNGVDAWARLNLARAWLRNPGVLPSDVWLPLHFWLLGAVLWLWEWELAARLFTALLGALTVLPLWGILRRAFDSTTATYGTAALAVFGFHVAYSTTTSSEAPTLFSLVTGVYAWVRFQSEGRWAWVLAGAISFSAASLCRFDTWSYIPILGLLLVDFSRGLGPVWQDRPGWKRALGFTLAGFSGALGWMVYSYLKWGNPLAAPRKTLLLNLQADIQQPLAYRLVVVPGALVVSLSPLVLGLAIVGLAWCLARGSWLARSLALVVLLVGGAHYYSAVVHKVTQARYTLMYSWLLFPFAFVALRFLSEKWPRLRWKMALLVTFGFFLVWQAGILAGAHWGPRRIADRLAVMAPTLPLRAELRGLTAWLRGHRAPGDALVVDEFRGETDDIIRFSGFPSSDVFGARWRTAVSEEKLRNFFLGRRPRWLVYAPSGEIGKLWPLESLEEASVPGLGITLRRGWQGLEYRVYEIVYHPATTALPKRSSEGGTTGDTSQ